MATQSTVRHTIEVLIDRAEIARRVASGPIDKHELVEGVSVSRSTVERALEELASSTLVETAGSEVRPTLSGRLAIEEFERLQEHLATSDFGESSEAAITDLIDAAVDRSDLLDRLAETELDKRGLMEAFTVSRSTVDRAVRELESLGVIERSPAGFAPTSLGRTLAGEYRRFARRIEGIVDASDLLSVLDPDVDLDTVVLVGADVVVPDPIASHVPGAYMEELVLDADRMFALAHAYSYARSIDAIYPLVVEGRCPMDVVFPADLVAFIRSVHPEPFAEMIQHEGFTARVVEETPFGLFVLEAETTTHVCLLVYDDDNELKGVIANTTPEAVEWGKETYRSHYEHGEPVSV